MQVSGTIDLDGENSVGQTGSEGTTRARDREINLLSIDWAAGTACARHSHFFPDQNPTNWRGDTV